jgi:hypothetical protein
VRGGHSAKMTCPSCRAVTPVGGHCRSCYARLPVALDRLVSCARCNFLVPKEAEWCPGFLSPEFARRPPPVSSAPQPPEVVWAFARGPVPGDRASLEDWAASCRALGPEAPSTLLGILRGGGIDEGYAALLGLRIHGYEAFRVGLPTHVEYKVRAPGAEAFETIVIGGGGRSS